MHKLEKLILESYAEILGEEEKKVLRLSDLTPVMRKALEKRYGKSIDPDKDFVSTDLETYYFTSGINKETGSIDHKVYDLPSFQSLYFGYSDIIDDVKQLMRVADVRNDKAARELFELIKSNFRQIQKYLRTERPDQYQLMKTTRSLEENISALKEYRLSIGSKEVARINKVGLNPEDWTVTFVDGTEEPYLNHLREITDINDPVLIKTRAARKRAADMKKLDDYKKSPEGKAAARAFASKESREVKAREIVRKLKIKRAQVEREMENDPGTEPQGGPVSDMYGDQLNKIDNAIEKAASVYSKPMDYDTAVGKVSENDKGRPLGEVIDSQFIARNRDSVVAHIEELLDDMGTSEVAMEYLGYSEEEAEDADHTVRADAANKIANDPELASEFLDEDDIKKIKSINLKEGEGDDHHYIKVKANDYKKAMAILDQNVDTTYVKMDVVDNDGAGNVIIYFTFRHEDGFDDMYDDSGNPDSEFYQEPEENPNSFVYDAAMDLRANDITIVDTSADIDEALNEEAGSETILEDATDIMLQKFPTLKATLIRLQTEDFKEFVNKIDWISPRPTEFRINLTNGQDYILKWTGKGFEAQIQGKRYFLNKINEFQQALDKLAILYKEGPMGEPEEPVEPADTDSGSSSSGGGDFPGEEGGGDSGVDAPEGDDTADIGDEEGGADLTDEPVDFEEPAEEPEV